MANEIDNQKVSAMSPIDRLVKAISDVPGASVERREVTRDDGQRVTVIDATKGTKKDE